MNPCRNLLSEFDCSEDVTDNNWDLSPGKNVYSYEDEIQISSKKTFTEMKDTENINSLDGEKLNNEVIAANSAKEPSEEELKAVRPYVGKEFESQDEAYDFYNRFAGKTGFSIRWHSTNKSRVEPFEVIGRTFCCSCQGLRDRRAKPVEQRKRQQADVRTDCKAVMMIKKRNDRWVVSGVVEEHNHKLVSPSKRHNLRSLRKINSSQKQQIVNFRLAGVKTNQLINYLAVENGGVKNIGFLPKDARNYLSTRRQLELKHGDAQAVLDYFERQQMENPSFFYSIQVDSEGQMTNFFWADAKSRMDYYYFGDVVCFDPTYSKNRYDMPFVPIVGINHHHQTVLFGGALLYSESEDSFEWVMKTWMRAMHGKAPKVILTDQESAIGGAIARVLPGTRHRYCLWHISRNAMKNLSNVTKEFVSEFSNCLYGYETVEQFEHGWTTMLENHELQNNTWLLNLYEKREYWASVYTRDIFCGDMYTTQRSESINSFFDGFLKRDLPLCEFVRQFERAVVARREAENNMDYETNYSRPVLRFRMGIEENAALVYTKTIFKKFQEQLTECFCYSHDKVEEIGTKSTYHLSRVGFPHKFRTVVFDSFDKSAQCSCLLYEFAGYLCRHILKVFIVENVQNLPSQHVLKRWTRDAKSGTVVFDQGEEISADHRDAVTIRYSKLCQDAINIAVKGSTSVPVYNVAVQVLQRALEEIEKAIKDSQVNAESQSDAILNENNKMNVENVGNLTNARELVADPPAVKRKGKKGAMKSWIDKLNKKRKSTETKARKKLQESTRLEPNDVNTQEKQPKKKRKTKDSFREINSHPESLHGVHQTNSCKTLTAEFPFLCPHTVQQGRAASGSISVEPTSMSLS